MLGMWITRPYAPPVMKSIACLYIKGPDVSVRSLFFFYLLINISLLKYVNLCQTSLPAFRRPTDILVRVRAVSINRIDERITCGYGRTLRRMIQAYNNSDRPELPLVLGRACAGIVEGVGRGSVSGLEIGDEVWLASPWCESGLASEIVVAPESRVGRKPFIIGFEGAASLPYSGCVALDALQHAGLDEHSSAGKRFVQLSVFFFADF